MTGPLALAIAPGVGAAIVPVGTTDDVRWFEWPVALDAIAVIEHDEHPRWVWWPHDTARALVAGGVRPARCWDLGAAHRMLVGGWRASPAEIWATCHGLDPAAAPVKVAPPDLFSTPPTDEADPLTPDRQLRAEWTAGAWQAEPARLIRWATMAVHCHTAQRSMIGGLDDPAAVVRTVHSESAAEQLCAELEADGLPFDVGRAETLIATTIGPRPAGPAERAASAAARDDLVLRHVPPGQHFDLRQPGSVKALLRRVGIEVPDTRAWRLEQLRDRHPVVDDLLAWRKAERISTTFGYEWIDANVGADRRLRGQWSASDGAAGRMTATSGLHNLPTDLRPAVAADRGHVFVRADLGQIEPRILAAVSGDDHLSTAALEDDMYAPVAARLGVGRDIGKVAVLGAMYGQTTGRGAEALAGLEAEYPVAMRYLSTAAARAEGGHDLRTRGGRLVRMSQVSDADGGGGPAARSRAAARGRYGRNALVQGAAAEFFKTWAAVVRAGLADHGGSTGARIVLCLHDELLVHAPADVGAAVGALVEESVHRAAHHWLGGAASNVRFVADVSVIARWSDAPSH